MKHPPTHKRMSKIRTDNCDDFIRKAAADMGDAMLLAKLSEGNLFARDDLQSSGIDTGHP